MERQAIFFCAVVALVMAAPPGFYKHEYNMEQSSSSYRNNELQHQNREAGRYTATGDMDSQSEPQVHGSYEASEYTAPTAAEPAAPTGLKTRFGHHRHFGFHPPGHFRHIYGPPGHWDDDDDFPRGHRFPGHGHWHHGHHHDESCDHDTTTPSLPNVPAQVSTGQNKPDGFTGQGKDYLENTEGQTTPSSSTTLNIRPVYEPLDESDRRNPFTPTTTPKNQQGLDQILDRIDEIAKESQTTPGITYGDGLLDSRINIDGSSRNFQQEQTQQEAQQEFDQLQQNENLGTYQQRLMQSRRIYQQQSHSYAQRQRLSHSRNEFHTFRTQHEDVTQQNQDKLDLGAHQQTQDQDKLSQLEVASQQREQHTQDQLSQQSRHDYSVNQQQTDKFGNIEFGSQHQEDLTQQQEDLTQHHQDGFGQLEVGSQHQEQLTQQTEQDFDKLHSQLGQNRDKFDVYNQKQQEKEKQMHNVADKFLQEQKLAEKQQQQGQLTRDEFEHLHSGSHQQTSQQEQRGFGSLSNQQQQEDMTQQTQDEFGKLEFGSQQQSFRRNHQQQEDLTQQTQDEFGKLEFGSQHEQQVTQQQQQQHGFGRTSNQQQQEDLTQQTQDEFGKLEFGSQHEQQVTQQQQQQHGFGRTSNQQQQEDLTQQTQDEFGKLEFGSQHEQQVIQQQQQQHGFGRTSNQQQQEDLTQQTQDEFGKLEFGAQHEQQVTQQQQQQHGFGRTSNQQQQEDLTQQTQDEFGKLEFGSQHEQQQQGTSKLLQQQEDLTQQTQDGFGKLEFGSQQREQQHVTQQRGYQQEDLTQQTQDEFGKLEFGSQQQEQRQMTQQQQQHGFGQHEDLTQQTQDEFGRFEFGSQQQHGSSRLSNQQHQVDLTQQTQDGFGNIEFGSQQHGRNQYMTQQHEDMTQQTQDEFGKFEFGSQQQSNTAFGRISQQEQQRGDLTQQHEDLTQQQEQLTQQTQDEFGKLEFGSQQQSQQQEHLMQQGRSTFMIQSHPSPHYPMLRTATQHQIPDEQTKPLDVTQPKLENAHEVQDVRNQVQKVDSTFTEEQDENLEPTEVIITTTEKPGFWKRIGGGITNTYANAKEKTKALAEKIRNIG